MASARDAYQPVSNQTTRSTCMRFTDETIQGKVELVKKVFPERIGSSKLHDNGEDFLILEVNDKWMFRFPRHDAAVEALRVEKQFLQVFRKLVSVPIPQIAYVGDDFYGYRKIEGILFTKQVLAALSHEARSKIAQQMGAFLSTLHSFPLGEARSMGFTEGWGGWRRKAFLRFNKEVKSRLSIKAQDNSLKSFDEFFALKSEPTIIHGDFYPPDHVFLNQDRGELSGVIDFGDLTIEDAVTDFKWIADLGEDFFREVMAHYIPHVDSEFFERLKIHIKVTPLFDTAYALEYGLDERFKERLQAVEQTFG